MWTLFLSSTSFDFISGLKSVKPLIDSNDRNGMARTEHKFLRKINMCVQFITQSVISLLISTASQDKVQVCIFKYLYIELFPQIELNPRHSTWSHRCFSLTWMCENWREELCYLICLLGEINQIRYLPSVSCYWCLYSTFEASFHSVISWSNFYVACLMVDRWFAFVHWRSPRKMNFVWNCKNLGLEIVVNDFILVVELLHLSFSEGLSSWYKCKIFRSKQNNYDEVVEYVARHLGLDDPSKIRLTSHNCYSQQPKPQPIKYRGAERLTDMLVHYNQVVYDCDIRLGAFSVDFCLFRVCLLTTSFACYRFQIYYTMKCWISLCLNCKVLKLWKLLSTMPRRMKWVLQGPVLWFCFLFLITFSSFSLFLWVYNVSLGHSIPFQKISGCYSHYQITKTEYCGRCH